MPHLNRAVDDPLIGSTQYYPYQSSLPREEDLDKPLDLNNLEFSLDDFQELTKGHYNAGELRLTKSGKLDIVNHHKTWTVFNHKTIDGADSFAIRVAFAKAMEAAGVGKKDMKDLRKTLGLHSDYAMRSTAALQPLTRQEVRQIIDRHIGAINANREPGEKLKTYDQLHARYSERENNDIRATRETINRTGAAPNFAINPELKNLLKVITKNPTFAGLSAQDAEDCLEFIDEITGAIECLKDDDSRINWIHENHTEYKVTVSGGPLGMALALEGDSVAVETISNGKLSRISLGLTPNKLLERIENARGMLNQIVDLDDKATPTKDSSGKSALGDAVPPKKQTGKAEKPKNSQFETIRNDDYGIRDVDESFTHVPQPNAIPQNIRRSDAPEIKKEPSNEERVRIAQKNLKTLASLIADQYELDEETATGIIKAIDDWEWELYNCSTEGNPTKLIDINDDLRDFILNHHETIQPLLDQAKADKI